MSTNFDRYTVSYRDYASLIAKHAYSTPTVPGIKKVIFNGPATIVIWQDGTKTIVKCSKDDAYDPEKGLAMAIAKYHFGNDNCFHKVMKPWIQKAEEDLRREYESELNGIRKLLVEWNQHKDVVSVGRSKQEDVAQEKAKVECNQLNQNHPHFEPRYCWDCIHETLPLLEEPCRSCDDHSNFELKPESEEE